MTSATATIAPEFFITKCRNGHVHRFTDAERTTVESFIVGCSKYGQMRCATCGSPEKFTAIRATITDTECGPKCMTARGPRCDCSCGGHNHSKGYAA